MDKELNKHEKDELKEMSKYLAKLQTMQRKIMRIPDVSMSVDMTSARTLIITVGQYDDDGNITCRCFHFYSFVSHKRNEEQFTCCMDFVQSMIGASETKLF